MIRHPVVFTLLAVWMATGCVRSEPSPVPLGRGPMALAELRLDEKTKVGLTSAKTLSTPERQDGDLKDNSETITVEGTARTSTDGDPALDGGAAIDGGLGGDAGDGGALASVSDPNDWLGMWQGKDTTRYLLEKQIERSFDDPQARIRVVRAGERRLSFVLIDSSNGQDLCDLEADLGPSEAKLLPHQSCFGTSDGYLTAEVSEGRARLAQGKLILDATLDATADHDGRTSNGHIEYHFEGSR